MTDAKDSEIQLNDAFERLEAQVAENRQQEEKPVTSEKPKRAATTNQTGGGGISGVLGVLFALIALGVASYGTFLAYQLQQAGAANTTTQEIEGLNNKISKLEVQVSAEGQKFVDQAEAMMARQQSAGDNIEARMSQAVAELKEQLGTSSEDWLLAEAEYLLRLANQRVAMEDDIAGALALFKAADNIIHEAEGIVAFELREAIANDIATLDVVSKVDVQGIFVRLGALAGQVPRLQQKVLQFAPPPVEVVNEPQAEGFLAKTQLILAQIGNRLAGLVDYRSSGEIINPILPPEEEYYLRQNLLLKLQLAQLGLLEGNQSIYRQSLGDALVWIDQYFDADANLTQSVRSNLSELAAINIASERPDVSQSLREIRKLLNRFHEAEERAGS